MTTAVVVCPGRGTYNAPELGYLARHFPDPALLARLDAQRSAAGQDTLTALDGAVETALRHDPRVIVEASAHGREVECSVLGNEDPETSMPGEILANAEWYDFEAKYGEGGMNLAVPAPISEIETARVRELAAEVFGRDISAQVPAEPESPFAQMYTRDMRTEHAGLFGGDGSYLVTREQEIAGLRAEREGERAEIDAVVAALAPLIAEAV